MMAVQSPHRHQHRIRFTAMAKQASAATRLPRGTKPVAQAFLTALDAVPEASRAAVSKASLAMIRDELKTRREKQRAARSGSAAPTKTARNAKAVRGTRATGASGARASMSRRPRAKKRETVQATDAGTEATSSKS